jgi:hypothetical protein
MIGRLFDDTHWITVFLVNGKVVLRDKRDLLIRRFRAEHVPKGDILEPLGLSDIVIIWLPSELAQFQPDKFCL